MISNVTIIGIGLIGGSLGISLKDIDKVQKVIGVSRSEEHINEAIDKKAIDEGTTDLASSVLNADLVIIATPIESIIPTLKKITPYLKQGVIVTDVGSTKQLIVSEADPLMPIGTYFIGSHPMAGSDRSGIESARAFLFDNAVWVFTPTENTNRVALDNLQQFLSQLDIRPLILKPDIHDKVVSTISHMPYLVASSLVKLIQFEPDYQSEMLSLAASGFRDTTRVANSPAEWGKSICLTNKQSLMSGIKEMQSVLKDIEALIANDDEKAILDYFNTIRNFREKMF